MMKKLFLLLSMLFVVGCGNSHNLLLNTGKMSPRFFHFSDKQTMDNFYFDTQKFAFKLPVSKVIDFQNGRRWDGSTLRDGHTIVFYGMAGHISISTNPKAKEYTERETIRKRNAKVSSTKNKTKWRYY
ncbi:MAG: hypothetical protein RBQ96_06395 [Candidatus Methanomethylophilaceae archaeon]|jgi:hypothetical protein|nr:hypothetical protein [Candidatus Methanomethylophilaceae archaeon]